MPSYLQLINLQLINLQLIYGDNGESNVLHLMESSSSEVFMNYTLNLLGKRIYWLHFRKIASLERPQLHNSTYSGL